MSLGRLLPHERLLLWRLRANKTQAQAARHFKIIPARYAAMELGRRPLTLIVVNLPYGVRTLEPYERCLLYRRRAKKSQAAVAKGMAISRYWVNRMERGCEPCDSLLWYWEQ